jgi:subtilisin family serine protease
MYQGYFDINSTFNTSFQYFPANNPFPANISGYPLYALDYNTSNPADACNELPCDKLMLSEKVVLIRRGTCTFITKIANAQKCGAQYVIIYTNQNPVVTPQSPAGVIAAMVSAELGIEWVTHLQEGDSVNFYFPNDRIPSINNVPNNFTGGTMSTFSSWSIDLGADAVLSGTSMATPYTAGVLALYMSAKGSQTKFDYQTLRQILATTATPLFFNDGIQTYPYLAPAIQQGGGLVNAFAVVHYTTIISPSTLSLNDSMYFNKTVEFNISNTDSVAVSYTLTHVSLCII